MTEYDAAVIQRFADALYRQAGSILVTYALIGGLLGLVAGGLLSGSVTAVLGGAVCGAIGASIGRQRGFTLRLQAQTALCQVQIERNTRR